MGCLVHLWLSFPPPGLPRSLSLPYVITLNYLSFQMTSLGWHNGELGGILVNGTIAVLLLNDPTANTYSQCRLNFRFYGSPPPSACFRVWSCSLCGGSSPLCSSSCGGLAARCAAGLRQRSANWSRTWGPMGSPWWGLDRKSSAWRSSRRADFSKDVSSTRHPYYRYYTCIWLNWFFFRFFKYNKEPLPSNLMKI